MGPLFPEANLNLIIALVIGFFFGLILEQAGFSTSKKLVGVFYGYDFTVWRVFFTAAITAMVGILTLSHFNLLDLSLVYINPLYLWSVVVGGIIMGFGFIFGGFCPGTSVCAAFIGKIDALFFMLGVAIGIFIFILGYPAVQSLYLGDFLGTPQIFDLLNISMGTFTFIILIFAFVSYWAVGILERKINKGESNELTSKSAFFKMFGFAVFVAILALFMSPKKQTLIDQYNSEGFGKDKEVNLISSDEIAVRLVKGDNLIQFIDLRLPNEFKELALPYAINIRATDLFQKRIANVFNQFQKITVIYSNDEESAKKAALLAENIGYSKDKIFVLKGGFDAFKQNYIDFEMPSATAESSIAQSTLHFRQEYGEKVKEILENSKPKVIVIPKAKRALGGCG